MNKLIILAIAAIFSTAFASSVLAEKTAFTADLKGASQVPPIDSAGTGNADVTYDDATKLLTWTITYSGLSGPVSAAHFHGPAGTGENAGPMITIKQLDSPMKGSATLTEDQVKALTGGKCTSTCIPRSTRMVKFAGNWRLRNEVRRSVPSLKRSQGRQRCYAT